MFLSDVDIKKAVKAGEITLSDFNVKRVQPASYDILLGNKFIVNDSNATHLIDPVKKIYAQTREVKISDNEEFILHPNVSVLGVSRDFIGSSTYLIQLGGKSSLARIGLMVHNTAGLINPGHFLNITLELCNLNNVPIVLRPGMEIGQLMFAQMSTPPKKTYEETGRYSDNNWEHYVPAKKKTKKSVKKKLKKK
jgi:dCTP deaminase